MADPTDKVEGLVTNKKPWVLILDFSKDLLEKTAKSLWVYPAPACDWADLGTPERLVGHLSPANHLGGFGSEGEPRSL